MISLAGLGRRTITLAASGAALIAVAVLIGFYATNLDFLSLQTSNIVMLSRLDVTLAPGANETIGRLELMQPEGSDGAELRHIELRNTDGVVTLRNIARQRRAFLSYRNYTGYSARWKLTDGDAISVGNARLTVDSASPEALAFTIGARKIHVARGIADTVTTISGKAPEVCKSAGPEEQIQEIFARLFSAGEGHVVFFLGGQIDCKIGGPVHLSIPGIPWRGLSILERNDGWYLAPGDPPGFSTPAFSIASKSKMIRGFNEIEWPVTAAADGTGYGALSRITIGRTTYGVEIGTADVAGKTVKLAFIPERRVQRLEVDDSVVVPQKPGACPEPKPAPPNSSAAATAAAATEINEAFQWKSRTGVVRTCTPVHRVMSFPRNSASASALDSTMERLLRWAIIAVAAVLAALVLFDKLRAALAFRGVRRWIAPTVAAVIVVGVFSAAIAPELASWFGYDLGLKQALLINAMAWFGASVAVLVYGEVGVVGAVIWLSFVGLVLPGALVQYSLALDAPTTRWVIQIQKHKLMFLDFVPLAIVLVMLVPYGRMVGFLRTFVADRTSAGMLCRTVPAYLLLSGLLFWFFRGNQQGVEGFQPVEFGKVAVIAILALLAVGLERIQLFSNRRTPRSRLVLLVAIGGPLLVVAVAIWQLGVAGMTSLYVVALSHQYLSISILVAVTTGVAVSVFVGRADYLSWLVLTAATLGLFSGALLVVPVLKKDFSPILIMMVVTIVICIVALAPWPISFFRALWWKLQIRRAAPARFAPVPKGLPRGAGVAASVLVVIAAVGLVLYHVPGMARTELLGSEPLPAKRADLLPRLEAARTGFFRTPIERVITWYDLDHNVEPLPKQSKGPAPGAEPDRAQAMFPAVQYPDLGFQVLRSKEALALAKCSLTGLDITTVRYLERLTDPIYRFFARDCHPLDRLKRLNASYEVDDLVRVPVIQNDFIGTYIVARFGLGAGLATLFFQGLALVGLVVLAIKLHPSSELDDGTAAVRRFLSIVMVGAAAVFGCQWLIAWANCLGLLPVMGQPMTFAAAATSHHLLLGLPLIVLTAVGMRVAQYRQIRISRAPPG